MTFISANDAFTNPNSPWYYVVGSAFLVLIIAALVIFILVSKKKRAANERKLDEAETISDTKSPDEIADSDAVENNNNAPITDEKREDSEATEPEPEKSSETEGQQPEEQQKPEENEVHAQSVSEEREEEPEIEQPIIQAESSEKAEEPEKLEKQESAEKVESAQKPIKKTATTAKKSQKPFIDRLIADKEVHGVYNELKNTILSYPGMKAKLGKDCETFAFGAENKAEISLVGKEMILKLAVDHGAVPSQFGAEEADGELKTKLVASESNIDAAQKLIMFAMNISMLTRNDRHRRVDYVQNAINAKNRAKAKAKK